MKIKKPSTYYDNTTPQEREEWLSHVRQYIKTKLDTEYIKFMSEHIQRHENPRALLCATILHLAHAMSEMDTPPWLTKSEVFNICCNDLFPEIFGMDAEHFNITEETLFHLVPAGMDKMMAEADLLMEKVGDLWEKGERALA